MFEVIHRFVIMKLSTDYNKQCQDAIELIQILSFSFAIQCNPICVSVWGLKLQNSQKLPHIHVHARLYCDANEKSAILIAVSSLQL